jgi:hypothetical protein
VLVVAKDPLDGLELFEHLLVMAAALIRISCLDTPTHHLVNFPPLFVSDREVEELSLMIEEHHVLTLLNLAPVVVKLQMCNLRDFSCGLLGHLCAKQGLLLIEDVLN